MGNSNGDWGSLASNDSELADAWDQYARLPEPGENAALDAFVESKHITIGALVRLGARLVDDFTLAYAYSHGIKFRNIVSGHRQNYPGSTFPEMKLVRAVETSPICIIAEGETEGARLSSVYPHDVFILPAGAGAFPPTYAAQVANYQRVLVATDNDAAGNKGYEKVTQLVPQAERFRAPRNDFCATPDDELPPIPPEPEPNPVTQFLVSTAELMTAELPERESFFDAALLPVNGQLVLHGWAKSFKSFLALDMMAALAQGQAWAGFESTCGPVKAAVVQFEIPPQYYRARISALRARAADLALLDENLQHVQPLTRPTLMAGNTDEENRLLDQLHEAGVEVVLIDPARRALPVANLNAREEIAPLLAYAQRLQTAGITVVICHHDNKASARAGGGNPLGMTGAGDFAGDCDSIVSVGVPAGSRIEDPKRNLYFTLRNAPSPSPRGFEMTEGAELRYSQEPFGDGMADDGSGPAI